MVLECDKTQEIIMIEKESHFFSPIQSIEKFYVFIFISAHAADVNSRARD